MRTPSGRFQRPLLSWIGPRPFTHREVDELRQAARFAAAPLATLTARATLTATVEAYLGRRSAARVLAGPLRRDIGETIQAALLYADLRNFTALSENNPPSVVISALDAWFDRIASPVHAFGGEVLKFIGDGVLAIFPVVGGAPRVRLATLLCARSPPREPGWRISMRRRRSRGTAASAFWRRPAPRRDPVGQHRCCRSAGFHGDRPRRQSGQPPGRAVPATRQDCPCLGHTRRRERNIADTAWNACAARHCIAMRGLHRPGELSRTAFTSR